MDDLNKLLASTKLNYTNNTGKSAAGQYPEHLNDALDISTIHPAIQQIKQWPGYQPTPLINLKEIASQASLAGIHYKDESSRFGLGSFKALGGAYAVLCLLRSQLSEQLGNVVSFDDVRSGKYLEQISQITVTSATDGNHGRSVAWGAQQFGCQCIIFIHAQVSEFREQAMQEFGAQVIRISGNYDESVHLAADEANKNGWFVISDTSYEGYTEPPRNVMAGYCVMIDEALHQLEDPQQYSHVFIQGGVGGLAGAVNAYLWIKLGELMPDLTVVEPVLADCLYQSALNQTPTAVEIDQETLMAGLSCGEVSQLGWQILKEGARNFITIEEELVVPMMQLLARQQPPIIAGESAIAGLAGLLAATSQPDVAKALGLNAQSQVLLLGTEGATDPQIYKQLTGIDPNIE